MNGKNNRNNVKLSFLTSIFKFDALIKQIGFTQYVDVI